MGTSIEVVLGTTRFLRVDLENGKRWNMNFA